MLLEETIRQATLDGREFVLLMTAYQVCACPAMACVTGAETGVLQWPPQMTRMGAFSQEFHALTEVAKTLASPLELPALLDAVLRRIVDVVAQADVGTVMLWDQSAGLFRPEAAFGFDLDVLQQMGLRAGEIDHRQGLRCRTEPGCLPRRKRWPRPWPTCARSIGRSLPAPCVPMTLPRAVLATPIATGEKKYGVLVLGNAHCQGGLHGPRSALHPDPG